MILLVFSGFFVLMAFRLDFDFTVSSEVLSSVWTAAPLVDGFRVSLLSSNRIFRMV